MNGILQPAPTFDVSRAVLEDYGKDFSPPRLDVHAMQPLSDALKAAQVAPDDRLMTFEIADRLYAVPMTTVLAYNVIQGQFDDGQSWMMTFCNACNTGVVFEPTLDGRLLHFQRRGAYDGLMLIYDEETGSFWQHIRGECLYGPSAGETIPMITATRPMTAAEAANYSAQVWLPVHELTPQQQHFSRAMEKMRATPERVEASIAASIGPEDKRRPRFELGLGVWEGKHGLFVPLSTLHMRDNVVMTTFSGRELLVYLTMDAVSPVALYVRSQTARWEGDALRLDDGIHIRSDRLVAPDGQTRYAERPNQLLMRWFGFAMTFPRCDILTAL